jgi:exopolysaccharide biosynthesis polyprenyl glycosylphosphotransferase
MAITIVLVESVVFFAVFLALCGLADVQGGRVPAPVAAVLFSGSSVAAFYYTRLYDVLAVRTFSEFLRRLPLGALAAGTIGGLLSYAMLPPSALSWPRVAGGALVMAGLLLLSRALWYRIVSEWPLVENVLVIGRTALARAVVAEMARRPCYRLLDPAEVARGERISKDGSPFHLPLDLRKMTASRPHRIVVALSERRGRIPMEALLEAKRLGIAIEEGMQVYERLTGKLDLDWLQPSHVIFSPAFHPSPAHCLVQRVVSVLVASAGLVVGAPLFALVALLVKLDSPGPVLFIQDRIGKDGRRFPLMKFRTMRPVVTRASEWVRDNGERITRVGRWLRKFRLDELPQLYNVLRGDMNLVGPRPHPASNYELFLTHIPYYAFRSVVRPGITGWAQVRYGYANSLEEETEKMRYDLYYIKHLSWWLDLRIMIMTIKVVLLGQHQLLAQRQAVASEPAPVKRLDAA